MSRALMILFILLLSTTTLSKYVYADNTIEVHIKQYMDMKMTRTENTSEAPATIEFEGRYVLTTDGKINGEYFVGTFTLECQGLSMQSISGSSSTSTSISPVSTTYSSIPGSPAMGGFEQACAVYVYSFNIKLKDLDEWFTNTYGRAFGVSPQAFENISRLPGNIDIKITYGGFTEYKGVPVFKFDIDVSGNITQSGYTYGIIGKATSFIYTGLYFPLYYDLNIQESFGMGDGERSTISVELHVETIDHNLPSNSVHAQYEQDDFIIIAGGYPNAKIHLKGNQGDNKIIAINEGTEPGYVSITYKPKTYKLASPTADKMIYILMPGENITINLKVSLSKDLDTYTEAGVVSSSLVMLIVLSIILIIVIAIIYIVHWIRRKTRAGELPTAPSTPSPEAPPTSPPPSQQPPPPPSPTSSV